MWCSTSNVERFRLEVGSTPNDAVFVPEWAAGERLEQRRRQAPEVERRIRPATAERLGRHVKRSPLKQALARGRALEHRGSFYSMVYLHDFVTVGADTRHDPRQPEVQQLRRPVRRKADVARLDIEVKDTHFVHSGE